jgi:hypothetical protein
MSKKKKKKPVAEPALPNDPIAYPFNDVALAQALEDITHAARNLFSNGEERERYEKLYTATSLIVDPLSYEITVLRILLSREMEKPEVARAPRKGRGADLEAAMPMVENLGHDLQIEWTDAQKKAIALWHSRGLQKVRDDTKREFEEAKENIKLQDPYLVVKLVNAISTCENVRSKLDSVLREEGYAFRRQQEDSYITEILAEVLQDDLATYWEVARRFNAMVNRRAVTTIKENIEREMRNRGQLADDEFLDD